MPQINAVMLRTWSKAALGVLAGLLCSLPATAKVAEADAAALGATLTPIGAERTGSDDGAIPPWTGGLTAPPSCFGGEGKRYCDPFAGERPMFTITAENVDEYARHLSPGQIAMLRKYPDSYRMPVYPTRRSFANPQAIYDATRSNATRAELRDDGHDVVGAKVGVPFPIPETGAEVIWNHETRFRGVGTRRWNNQFAVTASGEYGQTRMREDLLLQYAQPVAEGEPLSSVLAFWMQVVESPSRLAGAALLVESSLDPDHVAPRVYQRNPDQRRIRATTSVGYDSPSIGSEGLCTQDQVDGFNGPLNRYRWKLVGKSTLYVPANSYRLDSDAYTYDDIVRPHHLNPELTRYELRRVWIVDATLAADATHRYRSRRLYVDEDGWQIRVVDLYDNRARLWRLQEVHTLMAYDRLFELPVAQVIYDLLDSRYLVQGLDNEDDEARPMEFGPDDFQPGDIPR